MGRKLKFGSPEELEQCWEKYKAECNSKEVVVHDFSAKNSEFVTAKLEKSVTYTIEGFCVYAHMTRSTFYSTYANKKRYSDIVTRIKEECEVDAREKFELQVIPSQLAGLWMSKYGYTTKVENEVTGLDGEMSKLDELLKQVGG